MRATWILAGALLMAACASSAGTSPGTYLGGDGATLVDAGGALDAGLKDAGGSDAGAVDAGSADAGPADGGQADSGPSDAGQVEQDAVVAPPVDAGPDEGPQVQITTSMGAFTVQLNPAKAPITVANFLVYVDEGFYDGSDNKGQTLMHRVIKGFMVQGGGLLESMQGKATHAPIKIESSNGLKNLRGTIAMARTNDPNSATSQFFINHADNSFLDYGTKPPGYAVFGKVVAGIEVIDAIAAVKTGIKNGFKDVPVETIAISSVKLL